MEFRLSSVAPTEYGSASFSPRLLLPRRLPAGRAPFSGQSDDRARRALLHAIHDPLIHAQHELVEVFLRDHRSLIRRLRLDLVEHRVKLLFHLGRGILATLDQLLRVAAQLLHLLEQSDGLAILIESVARTLESLILRTLSYESAQVLRLFFQHWFSLLSSAALSACSEHESFAAREIEEHLDSGIAAVHRDHLGDGSRPACIDLEREKSASPKHRGRRANQPTCRRQSVLG